MLTAIVFDLDGTLVDSHADLAGAANTLLAEYGAAPLPVPAIVSMVGEGASVLVRRVLTAARLNPETPGALDRFLAIYDGCLLDRTHPYPGTLEMLERLRPRYRLGILTNKPAGATTRVLDGLGLAPFFECVVGGDTAFGRKPDPAGLRHVIDTLGATAETTMMVGDSPVDLKTAQNAGTRIALTRFGFGFTFAPEAVPREALVLDRPDDLLNALARQGARSFRHSARSASDG